MRFILGKHKADFEESLYVSEKPRGRRARDAAGLDLDRGDDRRTGSEAAESGTAEGREVPAAADAYCLVIRCQ